MAGFNICGLAVHTKGARTDDVRRALLAMPGVEVHVTTVEGRMVVTVEDEGFRRLADTITDIQYVDGVISASLVYQYSDQQDSEQESEQ